MGSKRFSFSALKAAAVSSLAFVAMGALSSASADFDDALRAYATKQANGDPDPQKVAEAIDLWYKYAKAGDVLSRQILGDIYSNVQIIREDENGDEHVLPLPEDTNVVSVNSAEALAWYTIAATHKFPDYSQQPDFRMINARITAQSRIPELTKTMSTKEMDEAYDRVISILESQSEYDLLRLGRMYRSGTGLPKDNVQALKYFKLALNRARGPNLSAAEEMQSLIEIMTPEEIEWADDEVLVWQPKLHDFFTDESPLELELAARERRIVEAQWQQAIASIESEFGSRNNDVIQTALAALGFYLGDIDGEMGDQTTRAVQLFQYSLVEDIDEDDMSFEEKQNTMTGVLSPVQKVELIEAAAMKGHPRSQYILGIMLKEGIGFPVDGQESVTWLKRSANYGNELAHHVLGEVYLVGIKGGEEPVKANRSLASHHFGQAAALGHKPAIKRLETLYRTPVVPQRPEDDEGNDQ